VTPEETLRLLEESGAILTGHFLLSSGLHSDRYVQCALALRDPRRAERLGAGIASRFAADRPTLVAGPALGGVIIAHEVARALGVPCIFSERVAGAMMLRRGFAVSPADRVVLVEDAITTGGSVLELHDLIAPVGAVVLGFGSIVDRTGGRSRLPSPPRSLVSLPLVKYAPDECPLCRDGIPVVKPGSRPGL
jgi:orotate phosphoribosyltransferase